MRDQNSIWVVIGQRFVGYLSKQVSAKSQLQFNEVFSLFTNIGVCVARVNQA